MTPIWGCARAWPPPARWLRLALWACWGSACSGDAFRYAPPIQVPVEDAGAPIPPKLGPLNAPVDAGAPSGPPKAPPAAGPCGVVRNESDRLAVEVCFESGSFTMGDDGPPQGPRYADHTPAHEVQLSAFALDAYEVTSARYAECVAAGDCTELDLQGCTPAVSEADADEARLPVACASHAQARAFCIWDGGRELPTEAQWERAVRGTEGRQWPWGEALFDCTRAALTHAECATPTAPGAVDSWPRGATPEGVHALAGNVSEWVLDWAAAYGLGPREDPTGPQTGGARLQRGGSYLSNLEETRGYLRLAVSNSAKAGFRCARSE